MNTVNKRNSLWRKTAWTFPTLAVIILAMPLSAKAHHRIDAGDLILGATLAYIINDAYSYRDRHYYGDRYHRDHRRVAYWPRRHYHSARDYRHRRYCDDHRHRDYHNYYYASHDYKRYYKRKLKRDRRDRRYDRRSHRREERRRHRRHRH